MDLFSITVFGMRVWIKRIPWVLEESLVHLRSIEMTLPQDSSSMHGHYRVRYMYRQRWRYKSNINPVAAEEIYNVPVPLNDLVPEPDASPHPFRVKISHPRSCLVVVSLVHINSGDLLWTESFTPPLLSPPAISCSFSSSLVRSLLNAH